MNPTRYNLALSRAKDAYNKKVRQNKMTYDQEKGRIKDHHEASTETLKKNHKNQQSVSQWQIKFLRFFGDFPTDRRSIDFFGTDFPKFFNFVHQ